MNKRPDVLRLRGSLAEWLAIDRDDSGKVFVPYAEIVLDMRLPDRAAA